MDGEPYDVCSIFHHFSPVPTIGEDGKDAVNRFLGPLEEQHGHGAVVQVGKIAWILFHLFGFCGEKQKIFDGKTKGHFR